MKGKVLVIVFLVVGASLMNAARYDEKTKPDTQILPLEEWKRDERVDREVYKIADELEKVCIMYKDDPEAIGWSPVAEKLVYKIKGLGESALPPILDVAKDKSRNVELRKIMMSELGFSYNPAVTEPLINFLLNKAEDESIRYNAADLLGRILKDTTATEVLIETIEDESNPENLRIKSASSFISIRDKRAIPHLIKIVQNETNEDIKAMGTAALGSNAYAFKDTSITPLIIDLLRNEKNSTVKMMQIECLGCLGSLGDKRVLVPLIDLLESRDSNFRDAIKALGNIGEPEAKEALIGLLKDKSESIRFNTTKALIKMGDKSVIPEIEKVLQTLNENHRRMIDKTLDSLKKSDK